MDKVDAETRARIMSAIRGKNTKPELIVRKFIYAQGLRYRLHCKDLVGSPDIVLKKYKAAIFVNGCFWHHHECRNEKLPKSNQEFWTKKIQRNIERDKENTRLLESMGWRVYVIWECQVRKAEFLGKLIDDIRRKANQT